MRARAQWAALALALLGICLVGMAQNQDRDSSGVRIVRFRPYRTKQDLLEHGVVTSQVYDRIKDYVIAHRDQ